jgi:hypothetical protein
MVYREKPQEKKCRKTTSAMACLKKKQWRDNKVQEK